MILKASMILTMWSFGMAFPSNDQLIMNGKLPHEIPSQSKSKSDGISETPSTTASTNPSTMATSMAPSMAPSSAPFLVSFVFDYNARRASLEWSDGNKTNVELKEIKNQHCIYKGSFNEDPDSMVVLTGCQNKLKSIQIESLVFGNTVGTTLDGTVKIISKTGHIDDTLVNPDFLEEFGNRMLENIFIFINEDVTIARLEWSNGDKRNVQLIKTCLLYTSPSPRD